MRLADLWHKARHPEYWPTALFYAPVIVQWLWHSLRAGSLTWPILGNPGIYLGGLLGESKREIMQLIPDGAKPHTLDLPAGTDAATAHAGLLAAGLHFPLVVKPDVGERGTGVEKLESPEQLDSYLARAGTRPLQVQAFIDWPVEAGLFYIRQPNATKGTLSSVVIKDFLHVKGDGARSVRRLMNELPRARFQLQRLSTTRLDLDYIPAPGEQMLLEPIGNHCRGTTFVNGQALRSPALSQAVHELAMQIPGFYYGRFDVKARSLADLQQGRFQVMELNGVASEPGHVYDPDYPLRRAWKDLLWHWRQLYRISRQLHARGLPYPHKRTVWKAVRQHKAQ
ncbi:MAG: hypothetical protein LW884_07545 [Bacteroidetes bacterium]|jgi:hypothetical protein|nr:hypothetical protein [Bacteroidota bacterium]